MKIYIGADHAGFQLKADLTDFVTKMGHEVIDRGADVLVPGDDYPDYMLSTARCVAEHAENAAYADRANDKEKARGIVIGGSGQGEAIVANRVIGIRAVVWYGGSLEIIRLSRDHNDSNVLSLGARFMTLDQAKEAVKLWLETPFSNDERHIRRIKKIDADMLKLLTESSIA